MGGKKPLRRPLWPPTRATASNYYPLGLDGAGGAAKPLLRAPKKPAPLHGRLPAFSGAVDAFERARKCFLEWRYFSQLSCPNFSKIVSRYTVKILARGISYCKCKEIAMISVKIKERFTVVLWSLPAAIGTNRPADGGSKTKNLVIPLIYEKTPCKIAVKTCDAPCGRTERIRNNRHAY